MTRESFLGWPKQLLKRFGVIAISLFLIVPLLVQSLDLEVNNALIWATGLVLLAYTIETQGMRLEMVRQNEMAIQPLLIANIELCEAGNIPAQSYARRLVLQNIGRGPALFVQVKDTVLEDVPSVRFLLKFARIDHVQAGKAVPTEVGFYTEAGAVLEREYDFVTNLNPKTATESYDVLISYEDINGQKRESMVRMGRGGIKLLRHGKIGT